MVPHLLIKILQLDVSNVSSMYGMFSDVVAIGILAFVGTNLYTEQAPQLLMEIYQNGM